MSKGYISLFFEDSGISLPTEDLTKVKNEIFSNYKSRFRIVDPTIQKDLQILIENQLLTEISNQLQPQNMEPSSSIIDYWNITVGKAYQVLAKAQQDMDSKITATLNYMSEVYNTLSDIVSKSGGIINTQLLQQIEQEKRSMENIANKFSYGMSEDNFKSAFFGSLMGVMREAQGTIHEAAFCVAAISAKAKLERELNNTNLDIQASVEATGGKIKIDSQLAQDLINSNFSLGNLNNSKNDFTIIINEDGGKVIWTSGISLKSTSSVTPNLVHIVSIDLTTLLNKQYNQNSYLNFAAGLGIKDWAGTSIGIAGLAKQKNISLPSSQIDNYWRTIIYNALYKQLIQLFAGDSSALNNVQYLVINSKVISMYDIFSLLENKANNNPFVISGISISGLGSNGSQAIQLRRNIVQQHVKSFVRARNGKTPSEARIERSSDIWNKAYQTLQQTKISISLKYTQLFSDATK